VFLGRRSECETLDHLLEGVRAERSGALVIRGEPGVGKTALLEHAIDSAADLRVARAVGVEWEMELAYAALQQLCAPMLDMLERLPSPQREALGTAFGLSAGTTPDRFLVSLAVLSLLSAVAETQPLLCVIDDAQWLDRASAKTLAFVARRLHAESVAFVFVTREAIEELSGLRELVVGGLRDADARELLASAVRGPLDERVRDRIIAEARGNPLALLELPRGLASAELAGGFVLPGTLPLPHRIEESFLRRFEALPKDARLLLLVAAAEPVGNSALLWRAARELGIAPEALEPAVKDGLVEVDGHVRFRHPLVRSAVYRDASQGDRRSAHAALAKATDPEVDPDRRAWHRAQATSGADEDVAAELEQSAGRAQGRGGVAAAAALLERAVELTADPVQRAQRALAAARAEHLAGAPDAALELLATAQQGPLDELGLARVDMLQGQIAYAQNRARDAPPLLLRAAKRLESLDVALARETYLDALSAAWYVGRSTSSGGALEAARATLAAPQPHPPRAWDLLLDAFATRFTAGYAASAPMLKRALAGFPSEEISTEDGLRWLWLAVQAAVVVWDDRAWETLATRYVELARQTGVLPVLPLALNGRIAAYTFAGELAEAASLVEEVRAVREATDSHVPAYGALFLAARRGREAEAGRLIEATVTEAQERGEPYAVSAAEWARALLYNGPGRYEDAMAAAERASEHPEDVWFYNFGLIELIEAAVRCGEPKRAADALERLSESTRASGSDWALGIEARSRALLNEGEAAERLYGEAVDRLSRTRVRAELGRAHLLFGEWLRRERRRLDARQQLRTAYEMFTWMGAEAFAERAGRELLATGERARKRTVETREDLTAQEAQIARLAGDGLSNPEIAARLFISPRTVGYHLTKVFSKLGISSRSELDRALPRQPDAALRI
jgi:DNA-binding CsgD family transcriptional regulator/tetratricopeptide (TPR) repeat protein